MKLAPAILLPFCAGILAAQQRLTIVLDPARGGSEYGSRVDGHTYEKQATLDLANRLRSLLNARDFNVVLTRETDAVVSNDTRATVANQSKPIACLLLHTTSSGTGLHLFTSSLTGTPPSSTAVLWDEAQAPFVQRSQRLANELTTAFSRSHIPISSARTWVRPLDNMQCPAIAIEIAPEANGTKASDRAYQTRIADAIAGAMLFWRGHQDIVESIVGPPPPAPVTKPSVDPAKPDTAAAKQAAPEAAPATTSSPRPTASAATGVAQPRPTTAKPATPKKTAVQPVAPQPDPDGGTLPPSISRPAQTKPAVPRPAPSQTDPDGQIVE